MDKVCSRVSRFINVLRQARNFATQVAPASRLAKRFVCKRCFFK